MEQKRIELKHLLNNLPFTKENFELLKEQLIDSIYPKSLAEEIEDLMEDNVQKYKSTEDKMSGIDSNFKEQELDEDYNAVSDYYEDNPEW